MQQPLLIYYKENEVEFWSIDQNKRLIPINCGINNKAPLYFLVNGDQIAMDQNAKMQFDSNTDNSFGNYWANLLNPQLKYNRFNTSHQFSSLLAYSIKENVLPSIIRYNYSNITQESFLNTCKTIIIYDSFIDEQHRNIVNKELIEVIGFNPNSLVTFDYWEVYRAYYEKNGKLNSKESFISINSALGDLNINLVAQNPTLTINKKTLIGRGNDPRMDTVLEYVAELAKRKGSLKTIDEIKKSIINEGPIILELLKDGWVSYKIKNHDIGIYPLNLDFHRDAIAIRLNNRASLNFIQSELENFRNNNQANGFKIFLNGGIINQDVFINFFKTTYSNVDTESIDFDLNFKNFIFNYFELQPNLKTQEIKLPTIDGDNFQLSQELITSSSPESTVSHGKASDIKMPPLPPSKDKEQTVNQKLTDQQTRVNLPPLTLNQPQSSLGTSYRVSTPPIPPLPSTRMSTPPVPSRLIPPLPPTKLSSPPVPPTKVGPPQIPTGLKPPVLPSLKPTLVPPTKVDPPQMPTGLKPPVLPPTRVVPPPVPPSMKPPPVPSGVKLPPPPPKSKK